MGGCFSGGRPMYIAENDGNEEAFQNRFLEDKILGEGQFGVVKLVHDMKANRGEGQPLACKTLRKGMILKDNVLYSALKPEVLRGECDILRALAGQDYCLRLVAIYETPKIIYVVTELCTGGEMMVYVSNQETMRTEDVSRIAFQLLSAVNHCAKHNVIHRDIKPENVMFRDPTANAELRLIDFGSGVMDPSPMGPEDRHKTFAGSAFYISPEMFQKTYTSKTDVWSTGVTLYVLAAGYPADNLQKAFNILQTSHNRDLSSLPGIPDDMSDSFLDMLDQLLCYRHLRRRTAGEMLQHEFVQFHKTHNSDTGLSIEEIVAAANSPEDSSLNPYATEDSRNYNDSTTGRRSRPLQSISMTGSIRRHNAFLNYQQFERSVTTLLATLLCNTDLSELLKELDSEMIKEAASDIRRPSEDAPSLPNSNPTMLQVVSIFRLKEILKERNQDECLIRMENLTDSPLYEKFAYHVALLHQFVMDVPKGLASFQNLPKRSNSVGPKPSSVHGSSVFAGLSKDKKADGALRRANSSDGLIRMVTAAEKLPPS